MLAKTALMIPLLVHAPNTKKKKVVVSNIKNVRLDTRKENVTHTK